MHIVQPSNTNYASPYILLFISLSMILSFLKISRNSKGQKNSTASRFSSELPRLCLHELFPHLLEVVCIEAVPTEIQRGETHGTHQATSGGLGRMEVRFCGIETKANMCNMGKFLIDETTSHNL